MRGDDEVCVDPVTYSATNGFSADKDAAFIALASDDGSDIGFMTLPPAPYEPDAISKWLISLRKKAS